SNEDPGKLERIDSEVWQPFYASFEVNGKNIFEQYLFPYGLVLHPNLRKSNVFIFLRDRWNSIERPEEIVRQLNSLKAPFIDTICGSNSSGFSRELSQRFTRMSSLGAPSSVLPFTMRLGRAVINHEIDAGAASKA